MKKTVLALLLVMILAVYPSMSKATVSTRLLGILLPPGTLVNDWGGQKTVNGYQYDVVLYDVPQSIFSLTQHALAQLSDRPSLQATPDGLMMSGLHGSKHWLIRLTKTSVHRTSMQISTIDWSHRQISKLAWMPTMSQLVFVSTSSLGTSTEENYVYQAFLSLNAFQSIIATSLKSHSWILTQGGVASKQQLWVKHKDKLNLFFSHDDTRSRVFIFYQKGN